MTSEGTTVTFTLERKPMIIMKLSKSERKEKYTRYWSRLMDMGAEFILKLNLGKPAQSLTYYLTQNLLLLFLSRVTNRLQTDYGSTSSKRAIITHIHRQPNLNFAH